MQYDEIKNLLIFNLGLHPVNDSNTVLPLQYRAKHQGHLRLERTLWGGDFGRL